ncbi:hypothetical protein ACH5RR_029496 [Cinchona calisaya]|uniref:Uncharacterized protein n=1 Tax=Cinchona calisaya TaxID=153742 RepID=A0ABD2YRT2_9GENT
MEEVQHQGQGNPTNKVVVDINLVVKPSPPQLPNVVILSPTKQEIQILNSLADGTVATPLTNQTSQHPNSLDKGLTNSNCLATNLELSQPKQTDWTHSEEQPTPPRESHDQLAQVFTKDDSALAAVHIIHTK